MFGLGKLGQLGLTGGNRFDPLRVRSPVFSPSAGEYGATQSVSISSTTVGATIRYTVDGSTPTNAVGTIYSVPISVAANTTIKAIAYDGVLIDSAVITSAYVIGASNSLLLEDGFFFLLETGDKLLLEA